MVTGRNSGGGGRAPKGKPAVIADGAVPAATAAPAPVALPAPVRAVGAWLADPFSFLGRHGATVRTFQPGATAVALVAADGSALAALAETATPGLFVGTLDGAAGAAGDAGYRLRIVWPDAVQDTADPYAFGPVLGDLDLHLFGEGAHWDLARRMGAVPCRHEGVAGTAFSVWAPNARRVSLIGDLCGWDGRRLPMRLRHGAGVWELFVPDIGPGARYKYEIEGADGVVREKADPLARATEAPPATASVVAALPDFAWTDGDWLAGRGARHHAGAAISIYELQAASWMRPWDGGVHDWDRLGDLLIPYVQDMGFSHVELMPIAEYPFGGSWGYQPLSQFAPSARFGSPAQFARFVDRCHAAEIGVILDWVPAHFPTDAHGFIAFDGTALYDYADPREGFHQDWNTAIYNVGRTEVQGFLIASALWWLETFHVDGLRVDAVASMLYRDYSREPGEWLPNRYGGRENLESIAFLKRLNGVVGERCPGAITLAEESTAFPGVTAPVGEGGLGFSYKWNMGWMNDTLRYMARDPIHRGWHHHEIDFGLHYAFTEKFVLPLSHDEVVHGKGSMLEKMPGDRWQKFANLRAYLAFMWAHPGKKLLFMGIELGQAGEWRHDGQIDWHGLADPERRGIQALVRDLNRIYRAEGALHHGDADPAGFRWIVGNDAANSVFVFSRHSAWGAPPLVFAVNMTPLPHAGYRIGVPAAGAWREILNSDGDGYGGGNIGNGGVVFSAPLAAHGQAASLDVTLPPLAAILLRYEGSAA